MQPGNHATGASPSTTMPTKTSKNSRICHTNTSLSEKKPASRVPRIFRCFCHLRHLQSAIRRWLNKTGWRPTAPRSTNSYRRSRRSPGRKQPAAPPPPSSHTISSVGRASVLYRPKVASSNLAWYFFFASPHLTLFFFFCCFGSRSWTFRTNPFQPQHPKKTSIVALQQLEENKKYTHRGQ